MPGSQATGVRSDKAYTQRMMGEGWNFKEIHLERMLYLEYGKELVKGSLVAHQKTHHGVSKGEFGQPGDEEGGGNDVVFYC